MLRLADASDTFPCLALSLESVSAPAAGLSHWQGKQLDPPEHRREEQSRQMALGQQKPVVSGMLHQPAAGLHQPLQKSIDDLDQQVSEQARQRPQARRLMTHPGVGPVTALATEVFLGDPMRFADGKAVASYIGMIPSEHSSGSRQRLGALSKQGNALLRFLWGEAAMQAVGRDPEPTQPHRKDTVNLRSAACTAPCRRGSA